MSVRAVSIFSKSSETAWPTNVTSLKLGMCILWVLGQNLARPDRGQRRSWVWITKGVQVPSSPLPGSLPLEVGLLSFPSPYK